MQAAVRVRSRPRFERKLIPQNKRPLGQRFRQGPVVVRPFFRKPRNIEKDLSFFVEVLLDDARRRAVGFPEEHVQCDTGSTRPVDFFQQGRYPVARPRPLAVTGQAFFVHVDDDRDSRRFPAVRNPKQKIADLVIDQNKQGRLQDIEQEHAERNRATDDQHDSESLFESGKAFFLNIDIRRNRTPTAPENAGPVRKNGISEMVLDAHPFVPYYSILTQTHCIPAEADSKRL